MLILACYNAGPQTLSKASFKVKNLSAHTQNYAERIIALHDLYLDREMPNTRNRIFPVKRENGYRH